MPSASRPAAVGLLATLAFLPGCPPANRAIGVPPRSVDEAVDRVNLNLAKVTQPLYCKPASVSFSFRDADGRKRSFIGHPCTIIFQPARDLYFDIKSPLAGGIARLGSNQERYWFYVDLPDVQKLWFGAWNALGSGPPRRLPIPPGDLLDAMMLRPLPRSLVGGLRPMLRILGDDQRLLYVRLNDLGEPVGVREVKLDPRPPYQPIELLDFSRDGELLMRAKLSNYKPVEGGGPLTPRNYKVEWPPTGTTMDLSIDRVRFEADLPAFNEFPEGWEHEREDLDAAVDATIEESE